MEPKIPPKIYFVSRRLLSIGTNNHPWDSPLTWWIFVILVTWQGNLLHTNKNFASVSKWRPCVEGVATRLTRLQLGTNIAPSFVHSSPSTTIPTYLWFCSFDPTYWSALRSSTSSHKQEVMFGEALQPKMTSRTHRRYTMATLATILCLSVAKAAWKANPWSQSVTWPSRSPSSNAELEHTCRMWKIVFIWKTTSRCLVFKT